MGARYLPAVKLCSDPQRTSPPFFPPFFWFACGMSHLTLPLKGRCPTAAVQSPTEPPPGSGPVQRFVRPGLPRLSCFPRSRSSVRLSFGCGPSCGSLYGPSLRSARPGLGTAPTASAGRDPLSCSARCRCAYAPSLGCCGPRLTRSCRVGCGPKPRSSGFGVLALCSPSLGLSDSPSLDVLRAHQMAPPGRRPPLPLVSSAPYASLLLAPLTSTSPLCCATASS